MEAAAAEGADVLGQLRALLAKHYMRVIDLLKQWDEDDSGDVDEKEFCKALPILGIKVDQETAKKLFAEFDKDGSGAVDIKELNRKLRIGSAIELDEKLQDGAVDIKTDKANATPLRHGVLQEGASPLNIALDASSDVPVIEQLAKSLADSYQRVIEVFRAWDTDMSGTIDKKEFRQGLKMLGLKDVSREQADELFDVLDGDHSGEIDYQARPARLHKGAPTHVAPLLPRSRGYTRYGYTRPGGCVPSSPQEV